MKVVLNNSDTIGIFTSLICSIHCFATPILFVAQSGFVSADIQPYGGNLLIISSFFSHS